MQESELFKHEKQENHHRTAGIEKVLPEVPQAPGTSGNQVNWDLPDPGA
jgi:hypothetical protein